MGGPPMGGGMGGGGPVRDMNGGRTSSGVRESFVPQRPSGPQLGLPGRWWDDKNNAKTIALRSDQQKKGRVFAQIDRVEVARADLEKETARILMLIRQQLDPTQLSKLDSEIANLR